MTDFTYKEKVDKSGNIKGILTTKKKEEYELKESKYNLLKMKDILNDIDKKYNLPPINIPPKKNSNYDIIHLPSNKHITANTQKELRDHFGFKSNKLFYRELKDKKKYDIKIWNGENNKQHMGIYTAADY